MMPPCFRQSSSGGQTRVFWILSSSPSKSPTGLPVSRQRFWPDPTRDLILASSTLSQRRSQSGTEDTPWDHVRRLCFYNVLCCELRHNVVWISRFISANDSLISFNYEFITKWTFTMEEENTTPALLNIRRQQKESEHWLSWVIINVMKLCKH